MSDSSLAISITRICSGGSGQRALHQKVVRGSLQICFLIILQGFGSTRAEGIGVLMGVLHKLPLLDVVSWFALVVGWKLSNIFDESK